ncbi:serine/threonine protein kinase [Streptomyces sp. NPDC059076]|uniref:serine/threonine protein kinase n=1 Tax=unclassified Streptomyces TaxID=2593676 RepID=UPI0036ABAED9
MDEYAGRVLADRYRLPLPPSDEYELAETRAFDTYSGQEVLVRQVPLPEIVEAEVVDADGLMAAVAPRRGAPGRSARDATDPSVARAIEAAQAAARIPDHPRLDQVFDVFAEAGSLWIVSERVAARPLAALLAERPLGPYRAAEVASDVLTALMVLHAHGWTHRNITVRTVLVCDDGRVVLTGLAAGAAEEALCGYSPIPQEFPEPEALESSLDEYDGGDDYSSGDEYDDGGEYEYGERDADHEGHPGLAGHAEPDGYDEHDGYGGVYAAHEDVHEDAHQDAHEDVPGRDRGGYRAGEEADPYGGFVPSQGVGPADRGDDPYERYDSADDGRGGPPSPYGIPADPGLVRPFASRPGEDPPAGVPDARAARAGAIAAYRAGAQAAARITEDQRLGGPPVQTGHDPDWWARKPSDLTREPVQRDGHDDVEDHGDHGDHGNQGDQESDRPGRLRLTGTWQDAPFPGQDGPPPLPAGGGFEPRHNPHRNSDPYGVRQLPPSRSADQLPDQSPDQSTGHGQEQQSEGDRVLGQGRDDEADFRALPAPRTPSTPAISTAGGWDGRGGASGEAMRADAQRQSSLPAVAPPTPVGWDQVRADVEVPVHHGPATPLAAERARQARITVVGAVTERWAPEQAGPVHENWQLAAPVGPATDLWALGALLYRCVQGHAPYPEENAAELVQLVCSEPPAFAEECGALRPIVESLLRQDPTERPDFEELRGWLRSLVRSAPEPEAGVDVVPLPSPPIKPDSSRLPVIRRRGELVRRRRTNSEMVHGRHRHKKPREKRRRAGALGRTLLMLILLLLAGAVAYALFFMPKAEEQDRTAPQGTTGPQATRPAPSGQSPDPGRTPTSGPAKPTKSPRSQQPQTSPPSVGDLPAGYVLRKDPEDFQVVVNKGWERRPMNDIGQVRYSNGDFTLIIVPGRDSVQTSGDDPMIYQQDKERELQPFRDSSWAGVTGQRRIEVGQRVMAEGQYTWEDTNGRNVFVRNLAMILDGRYHVVQVIGPDDQRDKINEAYREAADSYRASS